MTSPLFLKNNVFLKKTNGVFVIWEKKYNIVT